MTYSLSTRERRVSRLNRKGFTLIELIVVIAILAILAAIAIPAFTGQLTNAKAKADLANRATLKSAAQICLAENGSPSVTITWTSATSTPVAPNAAWAASKYIDTWPTNPVSATAYTVTITNLGAVSVAP